MTGTDREVVKADREAQSDGVLERSLGTAWEQLAPLSVGAVVSAAAIVGATAVLRRALGSSRSILGWAGAVALLPIGYWLLSEQKEPLTQNGDIGDADGG